MDKKFLLTPFFILQLIFSLYSQDIPYTGEEEGTPFIKITNNDLVIIEKPRFISPRTAKTEQEKSAIESNNEIWQQYQKDLELYSKIQKFQNTSFKTKIKSKELPKSLFYTYHVAQDTDNYLTTFNGLYARLQQKQGTLATVNHISSPDDLKTGMILILPVPQGLFIPKKASSTLEILLQREYSNEIDEKTPVYEIKGEEFYFLSDKNFSPTQTAFFHDKGMILPLNKKVLTSRFGYRTSPVTGAWKFHAGIDLAAPEGTEVYACKAGIIASTGYSELYGNYIDIRHSGKTTSRYAHLSKIFVKKGQNVSTGQIIGLVGTTGASTGPHLHFEVRENGTPLDPSKQIKNF
ncbi:M23 family metallopeptidase [Treponema sp.]|uniref:M23 family metallopeptidase n=1 Tax=Treponema sp. TaxID=166 RepID=UPI00388E0EC3